MLFRSIHFLSVAASAIFLNPSGLSLVSAAPTANYFVSLASSGGQSEPIEYLDSIKSSLDAQSNAVAPKDRATRRKSAGRKNFSSPTSLTRKDLPIKYTYGGPVLTGKQNMYIIYYGSWEQSAMNLTESFMKGLGNTKWFEIVKRYYYKASSTSKPIYIQSPTFAGSAIDPDYTFGSSISDMDIQNIIISQINNGAIPLDVSGIYLVAVAADVSIAIRKDLNLFEDLCGYHSNINLTVTRNDEKSYPMRFRYGLVADVLEHLDQCSKPFINNSEMPGVDGMLSILAHEIAEILTNPEANGSGWRDANGQEAADKCQWTYGDSNDSADNSSKFNMVIGEDKFMVQQMWDLESQECSSNWDS